MLGGMEQFLERHKIAKCTQEEINNLMSLPVKNIRSGIINFTQKKAPQLYGFSWEFYKIFKEDIIAITYNLSWKLKADKNILAHPELKALYSY